MVSDISSVLTSGRDWLIASSVRLLTSVGMRKDRLKHCRSISKMHLTTPSHGFRRTGWTKIITDLNQIILQNVGKGWFSYAEYCDGNWPFWSYHAEHVQVVVLVGRWNSVTTMYTMRFVSTCPMSAFS